MWITKKIRSTDTLPFGYLLVGKSPYHLGFDTALFPFNYVITWWRNKQAAYKLTEWEQILMRQLSDEKHRIYKEGYDKGYAKAINESREVVEKSVKIAAYFADLKK